MTDAGAATFRAVKRYGTAFGTRTFRKISISLAAYERMISTWGRANLGQALGHVDQHNEIHHQGHHESAWYFARN